MELANERCYLCGGTIPLHFFEVFNDNNWICPNCNKAYKKARKEAKIDIYDLEVRERFRQEYLHRIGK